MVEDIERAQARLDNINTVEPLLAALRTISLGSWQAALKQKAGVQRYGERLRGMLPSLLPHLPMARHNRHKNVPSATRIVALVIGSERGLCGRFNAAIVERTEQYLKEQADGVRVELWSLGSRLNRIFQRRQRDLAWSGTLSGTALPAPRLAFDLTRRWLTRYEVQDLDAVDVLYNTYQGTGHYKPTVVRLIPPMVSQVGNLSYSSANEPWPPPIIETDPLHLYTRIVEQTTTISLYECLLESAAAEHSARYQLMEEATQNAERLIVELTMAVQTARRQAITREMQELAAGAGLLTDSLEHKRASRPPRFRKTSEVWTYTTRPTEGTMRS